MASDTNIPDPSPFPSHSEMDLDMWQATTIGGDGTRSIEAPASYLVAKVYAPDGDGQQRDVVARRVEMVGDLYETLRRAAEKMAAAGLDISEEHEVLSAFCSPKPFPGA